MLRRKFVESVVMGSVALGLSPRAIYAADNQISVADVHNHIVSANDVAHNGVRHAWTNWSAERVIADQGDSSTVRSLVSYSVPCSSDNDRGRSLTRLCNNFASEIARSNPGRFVVLASMPDLNDSSGVLREIDYAYRREGVGGITVMTSYGERWLDDPAFSLVFSELNRRAALVFVQPSISALSPAMPRISGSPAARKLDAADFAKRLQDRWSRIRFASSGLAASRRGMPVHTYWWGMLPQRTSMLPLTLSVS